MTTYGLALTDVLTWIGALLLVFAGLAKLKRSTAAIVFVRQLGIPWSTQAVRLIAAAEVTTGLAALLLGSLSIYVAAALLYTVFAAALLVFQQRTGEAVVSCGCFGSSATVAVLPHVAALTVVGASTLVAAFGSHESLLHVLASLPLIESILLSTLMAATIAAVLGTLSRSPEAAAGKASTDFRILPTQDLHAL